MEQPRVRSSSIEHYPNQNKKTGGQEQLSNELNKPIADYNFSLPFSNEEKAELENQSHSSDEPQPTAQDIEYAQKELELQRAQQKARIQQIEEYLRLSDQSPQSTVFANVEYFQPTAKSSTEVKSVDEKKEAKNRRLSFSWFK